MTDPRALLDFVAALQRREELPVRERLRQDAESRRKVNAEVDEIFRELKEKRDAPLDR